jgi:hypothetical protein
MPDWTRATSQSHRPHFIRLKWLVFSWYRLDIGERLRLEKGQLELDLEENVQNQVLHAVDSYIDHKVMELARLKNYDAKL